MPTSNPRVTVLIPVRNRERYVGSAIESALGQGFADLEVLRGGVTWVCAQY